MKPNTEVIVHNIYDYPAIVLAVRNTKEYGKFILVRFENGKESWVVASRVRLKGSKLIKRTKPKKFDRMPSGSMKSGGIKIDDNE